MREHTGAGEVTIDPARNLTSPVWDHAEQEPDRAVMAYRVGDRFVDVTARQFRDEVLEVAAGLVGLGVEPGDRVCVFSATRYEWTVLDYAIWAAGAVT